MHSRKTAIASLHFVAVLLTTMLASATAHAQSWKAETERTANSKPKCPDVPLLFQIAVAGGDISASMSGGELQHGKVGADGSVSLQFKARAGTSLISGNAHTKDLLLTPSFLDGCFYSLKPLSAASEQDLKVWKVTIHQTGGNSMSCSSGSRGQVEVRGRSLMLFGFNIELRPIFGVRLAEDGSADVDTMTAFGRNSTARVKVEAGAGPRPFTFVTYTNVCQYRIMPD